MIMALSETEHFLFLQKYKMSSVILHLVLSSSLFTLKLAGGVLPFRNNMVHDADWLIILKQLLEYCHYVGFSVPFHKIRLGAGGRGGGGGDRC